MFLCHLEQRSVLHYQQCTLLRNIFSHTRLCILTPFPMLQEQTMAQSTFTLQPKAALPLQNWEWPGLLQVKEPLCHSEQLSCTEDRRRDGTGSTQTLHRAPKPSPPQRLDTRPQPQNAEQPCLMLPQAGRTCCFINLLPPSSSPGCQ